MKEEVNRYTNMETLVNPLEVGHGRIQPRTALPEGPAGVKIQQCVASPRKAAVARSQAGTIYGREVAANQGSVLAGVGPLPA